MKIENGRPEFWQGACHKYNDKSVGVCLIGKSNFNNKSLNFKKLLIFEKKYKNSKIIGQQRLPNTKKRAQTLMFNYGKKEYFVKDEKTLLYH